MYSNDTINPAGPFPSVRARVYRFVVDVLQSGHAMERGTYRYY